MLLAAPSWASTTYYVDALYTGGSNNGSAAHPWTSLGSGWSSINTALASGPVTVIFSALVPAGNSPETISSQIDLTQRTDTSTNILTLDGVSQYNTNSATPSWTTNVIPAPCTGWRCAATAPWIGKEFTVTGTTPISGPSAANSGIGYFTIQGFKFANSEGQTADLTYVHDLILQYSEGTRTATGSYGPGVIVGPGQNGPMNASLNNTGGPDNVTIQYNWIHATWGECIYVGAETSDPPGYPSSEYTANGMTCTTNCNTGNNYLIQSNTIESCASWGGQGDGTDVKDGHDNLRVIGNTYRTSLACSSCGTNGPGNDGQGPLFESGTQVIGNYVEAPGHQCIPIYSSWNNAHGRGDMLVANNICVNANSGVGSNVAFNVWTASVASEWTTVEIYSNTAYSNDDNCIDVQTGSNTGGVTAKNNICWSTGSITGTMTRDYNDVASNSEAHGISSNPQFVSTSTPYLDTNFELQTGSPAIGAGANLSGSFTTDYLGNTRTSPWSIGAFAQPPAAAPAQGVSFHDLFIR